MRERAAADSPGRPCRPYRRRCTETGTGRPWPSLSTGLPGDGLVCGLLHSTVAHEGADGSGPRHVERRL